VSIAAAPIRSHAPAKRFGLQIFATCLAALLLTELWVLRERFTTDALDLRQGPWAAIVRSTRYATPFVLSCLAATFALGGRRLREELIGLTTHAALPRRLWPFVGANLAAGTAFGLVSRALLEGPDPGAAFEIALTLAWWFCGALIPLSLVSSVLPVAELARTAWRVRFTACAGIAVGSLGFLGYRLTESAWPFWQPLAHGTLLLAHELLSVFFGDCLLDQDALVLGLRGFEVVVTKYCCGYEGVGLFIIFFSAFLAIARDRLRFPRALVLLPIGCSVIWLLNGVRIAVLVAIGALVSPEMAIDGFHVYAGWPLVSAVALGCVAVGTRTPYFARRVAETPDVDAENPTAAYLVPLLALIATALVSGAFAEDPAETYPLRIVAALGVLATISRGVARMKLQVSSSALVCGALAWALWIGLDAPTSAPWSELESSSSAVRTASQWVFGSLGSFVVVPIVEELAFRGYLYRRLTSANFERVDPRVFAFVPCLVSSLAFGVMHADWLAATLAGMVYAAAYMRRGRLVDAVVAHGATNLLLALQHAIFSA
jgi:exosortase E/protease (VPEID-CTERM system)